MLKPATILIAAIAIQFAAPDGALAKKKNTNSGPTETIHFNYTKVEYTNSARRTGGTKPGVTGNNTVQSDVNPQRTATGVSGSGQPGASSPLLASPGLLGGGGGSGGSGGAKHRQQPINATAH